MDRMETGSSRKLSFFLVASFWVWFVVFVFAPVAGAQTLGGITGTVTDASSAWLPDTVVTLVAEGTELTRKQKTNVNGVYNFVDLPIGTYTLTFAHDGF